VVGVREPHAHALRCVGGDCDSQAAAERMASSGGGAQSYVCNAGCVSGRASSSGRGVTAPAWGARQTVGRRGIPPSPRAALR
jgi:hypothetical protein